LVRVKGLSSEPQVRVSPSLRRIAIVQAVTDIVTDWHRWGIARRIADRRARQAPIRPFQSGDEVAALTGPRLRYFR
jgi:hypothetical protein